MKTSNGKRTPSNPDTDAGSSGSDRRRYGRVVHDDRGAASLEWHDAPDDYERPVLEVEGGSKQPLSIKNDDTFNPYDRTPDSSPTNAGRPGGKRDLKKLSAWLKMMREMEERKKNGQDD